MSKNMFSVDFYLFHLFFWSKNKFMKHIASIFLIVVGFSAKSQEVEIVFNKNIELFGYIVELGDPSQNDPNHPISKQINKWPEDKELTSLVKLFEVGADVDYGTIVDMMYSLPIFPHNENVSIPPEFWSKYDYEESSLQSLVQIVNQFSKESHFESIWESLAENREKTIRDLGNRKPNTSFMKSIEAFYGQSFSQYEIVPSLTVWSGPGWGIKNKEETKATFVMGPLEPDYDFEADHFTTLTIHEFGHSFVNHVVLEHESLINQTRSLFNTIEKDMYKQGYSDWMTCMIEHFVRAGEVIISDQLGEKSMSESLLDDYVNSRKFIYLEFIIGRLSEYRLNRSLSYEEAVERTIQDFSKEYGPIRQQLPSVSGQLLVQGSNEPIPFAHIGIKGKNLGTISRLDGSFTVDLSKASSTDSLVFSALGYRAKGFVVSELRENMDVYLEESIILLDEVVVSRKGKKSKVEKFGRYKPTKTTRGQNGLMDFGFGGEQGIRIANEKTYFMEEISFHMRFNSVDSILFRINIYEVDNALPGRSLLNKNLFVTSKKGQKWIKKDVTDLRLIIDREIIISYEVVRIWYNPKSANNIYFTYGDAYPEGGVFLRRSSLDKWITKEPDAFPITLYVAGKIYE